MRRAPVTWRKAGIRCAQDNGGLFVAHEYLGLHTADAGKRGELLDKVVEQIPVTPPRQNLIHRLERNILFQLLFLAGVADAADLRTPDHSKEIKFIKRTGGFGEG